jgi:Fic family protein
VESFHQSDSDIPSQGEINRNKVLEEIGDELISRKELVEKTGLSDATVKRRLKELVKDGVVEPQGTGKNTRYRRKNG